MKQKLKPANWLPAFVKTRWFVWLVVFLAGAAIAYLRYPNYVTLPNFYSEDGTIFAQNILDKGFLAALFTPFNGYLVAGLYLLEGIGFGLNMFLGGSILSLPLAFAIVSYAFWGAVCALPLLLFWREVKHKSWLVVISASLALLPIPSFNYAMFGTLGNYKFAFLFIAFLLLLKRHWLPAESKLFYWVDAALVLCASTNITVVLLLPFALLRYYGPGRKKINVVFWRSLLTNKSFLSLAAAGMLITAEIVLLYMSGGFTPIKGYMDEPFNAATTIEIFAYRTLLFPFAYPIAMALNNLSVLLLLAFTLVGAWSVARREDRIILLFGTYAALVATALFVSQRTGVSLFFINYTTSATDQFFYPQNWIFMFSVLFVLARGLYKNNNRRKKMAAIVVLCLLPVALLAIDFIHRNASIEREQRAGSFSQNANAQCKATTDNTIKVPVYPMEAKAIMTLPRSAVCK